MTNKSFCKYIFQVIVLCILSFDLAAQTFHEPKQDSDWIKPYTPFRIAGNLYYVGTYELACYLITTSKGNILINTGTSASAALIKNSIESLGFKLSNIKILLLTHAHYDHVGALAEIKRMTGATLMVDEKDAKVLADGGASDYYMGKYGVTFQPVKPDRLLHDGDKIILGDMTITMLHHPGHTKGSCSFLFTVKDDKHSYKILIANLPSIIIDGKFSDVKTYPGMAQDYAYTLQSLKHLSFDLWFASHASQFRLEEKHKPGDAYNPEAFRDQRGYDSTLNVLQKVYDEKLKQE